MSSLRGVIRRIGRLEKVFSVEPGDDWMEILMWDGVHGGKIFRKRK